MVKISHRKRFQRSTHFDRFVNNLEMWFYVFIEFNLLAFDVGDYYGYIIMLATENPSERPSSSKIPWLIVGLGFQLSHRRE